MSELDFAETSCIRFADCTGVVAAGGIGRDGEENCGVCFLSLLQKQSHSPVDAERNPRISSFAADTGAPIPLQGLLLPFLFPDFTYERDSFQECSVALVWK